jgi:Lar family restriction alleviation protein
MKNDLLPCPFCGGERAYAAHQRPLRILYHKVKCRDCGANLPLSLSKERAIEAWNTRIIIDIEKTNENESI